MISIKTASSVELGAECIRLSNTENVSAFTITICTTWIGCVYIKYEIFLDVSRGHGSHLRDWDASEERLPNPNISYEPSAPCKVADEASPPTMCVGARAQGKVLHEGSCCRCFRSLTPSVVASSN